MLNNNLVESGRQFISKVFNFKDIDGSENAWLEMDLDIFQFGVYGASVC